MIQQIARIVARSGARIFASGFVTLGACTTTPEPSSFMILGPAHAAPIGYSEFCGRYPDQCGRPGDRTSRPALAEPQLRSRLHASAFWAAAFNEETPLCHGRSPACADSPPNVAALRADEPSSNSPPGSPALAPPVLTPELWAKLQQVNRLVNRSISPQNDLVSYGVGDRWALPMLEQERPVGDCKDYVLEKRRLLMAYGIPRNALSITVVRTKWNAIHAVLVVATSRGEYVMDNLSQWLAPWRSLDYRWVIRQRGDDDLRWAEIGPSL